jgi:hypothetical protein
MRKVHDDDEGDDEEEAEAVALAALAVVEVAVGIHSRELVQLSALTEDTLQNKKVKYVNK